MTQNLVPAALDGEILGPDDGVRVIGAVHPLRNDRVERVLPAGLTMSELIAAVADVAETSLSRRFVAYLNGEPVPEDLWSRVRPKPGTTVTFRALLEKDAFRSIAMIAVAVLALVVAPWAAGALFPALAAGSLGLSIATGLIGAAITIGGTLAVNALFPVRPPQLADQTETKPAAAQTPSYSIGGGRNSAQQWAAIPSVLGVHRMSPMYASTPYTEIVGDDLYLRLLFVWGYGPMQVEDLRIGESPLSAYGDVEVQTAYGLPSDLPITLYPGQVFEEPLTIELVYGGGPTIRTTAADVDEISIDITAPSGVFRFETESGGKTGEIEWQQVDVMVQYRALPSGSWSPVEIVSLGSAEQKVLRRGWRKAVPRGQYSILVERVTPLDTSGDRVVDTVALTAIRGMRAESPVKTDKPVALTALRIRATSQLNGTIDTFNGLVSTFTTIWSPVLNSWTGLFTTSNPANLFRHVLQGAANARPVPDSKIDLLTLATWAEWCFAKGYTYNAVITERASVWSVLADIAAAGRAVVTFRDGKWSVIYDRDDLPVVQHFTPRNSWSFSASRAYRTTPHAFRIRFLNAAKGYLQDERIVYDDGYDATNATLFEAIELPGKVNADEVWRFGRYHIAQARLRPETYKLQVDLEHLVCTRGDRVRVSHDVPLWGQISGRVKAIDTATRIVTLDETVIVDPSKTYCLRFRAADGSSLFHPTNSAANEVTQLTLVGTDPLPAVGDLWMFGETNRESVVLRVLAIEPGEDLTATLTLVDDAPEIALADQGAIPPFDSKISDPVQPGQYAPANLAVTEYIPFAQGRRTGARLSWQVVRVGGIQAFEIEIRDERGRSWRPAKTVPAPQLEAEILDLTPGLYSFRVRALYANLPPSRWTEAANISLTGLVAPPATVDNFQIAVIGDVATLTWDAIPAANIKQYQIRFAPVLSGATWGAATILRSNAQGTQVQVPAMVGTYLIKAITHQGIWAANPAMIVTDIAGLANMNVVETRAESPTFPGVKTDVFLEPSRGGLMLVPLGDVFAPANWFASSDFFLREEGLATEGTYAFSSRVDLGNVYTSRVTAAVDAYGELLTSDFFAFKDFFAQAEYFGINADDWDVTVEVRTTRDDPSIPANWSGWAPLVVGDYTARAFLFRARLSASRFGLTPVLRGLSVTVDMPDRVEAGQDIVVPAGGLTVAFTPPFKRLLGLSTATQDLEPGDRAVITGKTAAGFTIQFKDASGTGVVRTFDYLAKGYGRVTA